MKSLTKTKKDLVNAISSKRQIKPEILDKYDYQILMAIYKAMELCPDYVGDAESYLYRIAQSRANRKNR